MLLSFICSHFFAVSGLGNVFGTIGGLKINSDGHDTSKPIGHKYKGTNQGYRFADDGLNF